MRYAEDKHTWSHVVGEAYVIKVDLLTPFAAQRDLRVCQYFEVIVVWFEAILI